MPASGFPDGCVNPLTESLIVSHVFRAENGYQREKLNRELSDLSPAWVTESIASLERAGVIRVDRGKLYPTDQLRRLAALDMIGS